MPDGYELLEAPWHGKIHDSALPDRGPSSPQAAKDTETTTILDQLCEKMATVFVAENMGSQEEFAKATEELWLYLNGINRADLEQMVLIAVCKHATERAQFIARQIPDKVPDSWLK